MADIARTAASIALVYPTKSLIFNMITAVAVEAGQPVYENANGMAALADANGVAPANTRRGIALQSVGPGQGCSVLRRGHLFGYNVDALNPGAQLFVSDTVGELADAAGTASLPVGRVERMPDEPLFTKVVHIDVVGAG